MYFYKIHKNCYDHLLLYLGVILKGRPHDEVGGSNLLCGQSGTKGLGEGRLHLSGRLQRRCWIWYKISYILALCQDSK